MRTIKEDLNVDLHMVQRWWLRLPVIITFAPTILIANVILGTLMGFLTGVNNIFVTIKGPSKWSY